MEALNQGFALDSLLLRQLFATQQKWSEATQVHGRLSHGSSNDTGLFKFNAKSKVDKWMDKTYQISQVIP